MGEGGSRASETMFLLGVIKPKPMKTDKGRGVIKLEKWADVVYGWPLITFYYATLFMPVSNIHV
jgi:hypothetical protein